MDLAAVLNLPQAQNIRKGRGPTCPAAIWRLVPSVLFARNE